MTRRGYRLLLQLLPGDFRARYGSEMEEAFAESLSIARVKYGRLGAGFALALAFWDLASLVVRLRPSQKKRSARLEGAAAGLLQDFRFAFRRLRRAPVLTLASVVTLSLGIGATVLMLVVIDAVLLRPLAYPGAERLVAVFLHEKSHGARRAPTSPVNFLSFRSESRTLRDMTAAHPWSPSLTGRDRPDELHGLRASPSLFELLGVPPFLGRTFDESDDARSVVLSHDLWTSRFGADPSLVGQTLTFDGEAYTVLGVMPRGFRFPPFWATEAEMWAPLVFTPASSARHSRYLRVFARLSDGVSFDEARSELETLAATLEARYPNENAATGVTVEPLLEPVVAEARPALVLLLASVVLLTLIACANVANLQLVRAASRAKEFAIEAALGSGKLRSLRQQLAESTLLALFSGIGGGLIAVWGVPALVALAPDRVPRLAEVGLDPRLFFFALVVTVGVVLLLGFATTPRSIRGSVATALHEAGSRTTSARSQKLRDGLVVLQLATSAVLLVAAGLVVRSFLEARSVDPGFRKDSLLTSSLLLAGSSHTEPARQTVLFREIRDTVLALEGVRNVALINHLPIGGDSWGLTFELEGSEATGEADRPRASQRTVTSGYFQTLGVPLLAGRDFSDADDETALPAVIVNRTLAERYGGPEAVLGRRLRAASDVRTIVGVVADTSQWELTVAIDPEIYFPYAQNPASSYLTTTLVVLSGEPPERLMPRVEQAVWSVAGEIPIANVRTMESILSAQLAPRRFTSLLFAVFAALALALAAVGLYGVLSYSVSRQTMEIGIRAALGASRADISTFVLGRGVRLIATGIALGLAASYAVARAFSGLLFRVQAGDPATFVSVALFLLVVGLVAMYLPARRAAHLDPLLALRNA